jgi:predicted O-methyltransferase YrrM
MDLRFEVDDKDMAFTYVNDVKGTLNQMDTRVLLNEMSMTAVNSKYVETGSYLGCSAVLAGLTMKRGALIYCHDLWLEDMSLLPENGIPPPMVNKQLYEFYKNIKSNDLEGVVIPIRGDSSYTLGIHDDNTIDLAFIDGDHSKEGVQRDLEAVFPKMKNGGSILCHDCYTNSETLDGVKKFCIEHNIDDITGFKGSSILKIAVKKNHHDQASVSG